MDTDRQLIRLGERESPVSYMYMCVYLQNSNFYICFMYMYLYFLANDPATVESSDCFVMTR